MSEQSTGNNNGNGNKNIFDDRANLLSYYSVQAEDFRMRHTAIWLEVKHYTWVLSVILGTGGAVLFGKSEASSNVSGLLAILPILGIFIAYIAFTIIKRDFDYFTSADSRLLYLEKLLGVTKKSEYLDNRLTRASSSDFTVVSDIKKQAKLNLSSIGKKRPQIRALILFTFCLYALVGFIEIGYLIYIKCSISTPEVKIGLIETMKQRSGFIAIGKPKKHKGKWKKKILIYSAINSNLRTFVFDLKNNKEDNERINNVIVGIVVRFQLQTVSFKLMETYSKVVDKPVIIPSNIDSTSSHLITKGNISALTKKIINQSAKTNIVATEIKSTNISKIINNWEEASQKLSTLSDMLK